MMSSHRKTRSSSACHGVRKRTKVGALTVSAGSSANTGGTTVERLFCSSREGVWWYFGELEGNVGDIVSGTGVPWESILPLLVANKFLTPVVTSTVKSYRVNVRLIDVFFNSLLSNYNCRLQITTMRYRGQTNKYFFCHGTPHFQNPTAQQNAINKAARRSPLKTLLWRLPGGCTDDKLQADCRVECSGIHAQHLMRRVERERERNGGNRQQVGAPADQLQIAEQFAEQVAGQIEFALTLNLNNRIRLSRSGATSIVLHDRRQANEREKAITLVLATQWGYLDPYLTEKERERIALAACTQTSYDFGFKKVFGKKVLPRWYGQLNKTIMDGESTDPLSPRNSGTVGYIEKIEERHPGYLHELFRHAQVVKGGLATFGELSTIMNRKSAVVGENRATLNISRKQLSKWFMKHGGKEKSAIEKPLLTTEHKKQRLNYAREHFDKIKDPQVPFAFLDEKWFYTTNRRRKIKVLPQGENEQIAPDALNLPKIRSRRFPVKVMFLGVVAAPNEDHNFDGRIMMKRISKRRKTTRASRNKNFSVDVMVNEILKDGEKSWHRLFTEGMSVGELLDIISETYDLDQFVAERLEMSYKAYTTGGKEKRVVMESNDVIDEQRFTNEDNEEEELTLKHVEMNVFIERGEEVDEDVTCDSEFMLTTMPEVGQAIRECYHWIPQEQEIYLGMDNAGGHGTVDAKKIYTEEMKKWNITIVWQVPRSPETNMLDLGVWMSIQSAVTVAHRLRRCNHDALARSVMDAWNNYLSPKAFANVHGRLKVVLKCIVDGAGGNELVEQKRGKLFNDCTIDLTGDEDGDELPEGENDEPNNIVIDLAEFDISDDESLGDL